MTQWLIWKLWGFLSCWKSDQFIQHIRKISCAILKIPKIQVDLHPAFRRRLLRRILRDRENCPAQCIEQRDLHADVPACHQQTRHDLHVVQGALDPVFFTDCQNDFLVSLLNVRRKHRNFTQCLMSQIGWGDQPVWPKFMVKKLAFSMWNRCFSMKKPTMLTNEAK